MGPAKGRACNKGCDLFKFQNLSSAVILQLRFCPILLVSQVTKYIYRDREKFPDAEH